MSMDGQVVLIERIGEGEWDHVVTFSKEGLDLRDVKLSVAPDGRLFCLSSLRPGDADDRRRAMVWFSEDGETWTDGKLIGDPNVRIWDVTWNHGTGYAVGYSAQSDKFVRLYKTPDGRHYSTVKERLYETDFPNETTLGFPAPDRAMALCRRNRGENPTTVLGKASEPFTDWEWCELDVLLGGPNLIRIPDTDRWLAGGRVTTDDPFTGVLELYPEDGRMELLFSLPSGGDNGYPGFCIDEDILRILYYSSDDTDTHLREASVPLRDL